MGLVALTLYISGFKTGDGEGVTVLKPAGCKASILLIQEYNLTSGNRQRVWSKQKRTQNIQLRSIHRITESFSM